jgi:hypothetical protein
VPRSIAERICRVNHALVVAVIAVIVCGGRAVAHPEFAPQTVNRYIKFDLVAPDRARLAYTIMVGAAPAAAARARADANHDGRVDESEARALGETLRGVIGSGVMLTVDGKKVAPAFDAPVVGLAGDAVAPSPFSVDLVAMLPCPGAPPHTIGFDDAPADPLGGETEIRIEESPATRLVTSHRGPTGNERETRFLFAGPKFSALEDRSIAFSFDAAKAPVPVKPPGSAVPLRFIVIAGIALLLLGGAVGMTARRRQRKMNG